MIKWGASSSIKPRETSTFSIYNPFLQLDRDLVYKSLSIIVFLKNIQVLPFR